MLKLFYTIQEGQNYGHETHYEQRLLKEEIKGLNIGLRPDEVRYLIEKTILVEHVRRRDALSHSFRFITVKENGQKKKKRIIEEELIRGQLHEDTFLGAITQWKRKGNKIVRDSTGKPVIDDTVQYVTRVPLKYKSSDQSKGFKRWEDLENAIVNKELVSMMKEQFPKGTSFKDACEKGIYMYKKGKKGEDRYVEKNRLNRIRKVRCYVKGVKNPKRIKKQTYPSKKDYKNWYYAKGGEPYVLSEYGKDQKLQYRLYTLFEISNRRKQGLDDVPKSIQDEKGNTLTQNRIIHLGDTVLLYDKQKSEVRDLDNENIAKRLYVVKRLTLDNVEKNYIRILLLRSSYSGKILDSKKNNSSPDEVSAETIKGFTSLPTAIRASINTVHFLLEGEDFSLEVDNNGKAFIDFKKNAYD